MTQFALPGTSNAVPSPRIAGLLLAAGSGRRFGGPKALADTGAGPWVLRALATLESLDPRVVVVGAAADAVAALLPDRPGVFVVRNADFASGMGSSLVAGLRALGPGGSVPGGSGAGAVDAAVVMLVDLPDVPASAVRRIVAAVVAQHEGDVIRGTRESLARAVYHGSPGHPVLIGAAHFAGVIASAAADHGARNYLGAHVVTAVECGDLATGVDRDTPGG